MTVKQLTDLLDTRLKTLSGINVFSKVPIDNENIAPYIQYKLYGWDFTNKRKQYLLEVNYWDTTADNTTILQSSEYVKNGRTIESVDHVGLDLSVEVVDNSNFYRCYLDSENMIEDGTEFNESHFQQNFLLKVD